MAFKFKMKSWSIVWLISALICLGLTIYFGYRFMTVRNSFLSQAREEARKETNNAAKELNQFIMMLKPIAHEVADIIGSKSMTKQEIIQLLKEKKPNDITGLGVAFVPYAIDPTQKLFSPYYVESEGKEKMTDLTEIYDYTKEEWFDRVMQEGAQFLEPYYAKATKSILADYLVPIYRTDTNGKKEAIGIVYANQSVEHLNHILDTLFLDHAGYWAMLAQNGTFLAHPQDQLIHRQVTIFDIAKQLNNEGLSQAAKQIIKQQPVFYEYKNEITDAPSWLFSQPLKGTDWSIIGVFDKGELNVDPNVLRRHLIHPSCTFVLFMIFITLFFILFFTKNHATRWWLASSIIAFVLAGQIGWIWFASYTYAEFQESDAKTSYTVKNKKGLYDYLKTEAAIYRYGKKISEDQKLKHHDLDLQTEEHRKEEVLLHGFRNPRYIPTGIFVNNVQFVDSNQIQVSGYVWQRFINGIHDDAPRGITFPQASETTLTKLSKIKKADRETILWEMHVTLDQTLYFNKYPFDTKALQIQLWNRYTKQNIILIPDLNAYQLINPRSLPGVDNDVFLPGWDIIQSSFGFKKVNYTSNFGVYSVGPFGIYSTANKSEIPELYFDIFIKRRLIDTLISDLLPIAVIAVFLFLSLLTSTQQKFSTIIGSLASIFFATIFSQIRFRGKIPAAQVVYFESFFFVLYAMLLAILIITMAKHLKLNARFIQYRDNFIAKLLYWPTLLGSLALVTLYYLY